MELDCDVIVIGSGIGGVSFASAVAQRGYKVLIFEAGHISGGYCQSFARKGFRFVTSVHKVGGDVTKATVDSFLAEVGGEPVSWHSFGEHLRIGGLDLDLGAPSKDKLLAQAFPHEAQNLSRFFQDLHKALHEFIYFTKASTGTFGFNPSRVQTCVRFSRLTTEQLLNEYLTDPRARAAIYAMGEGVPGVNGIGLAIYLLSNQGSAWLPEGGMESVVDRMIEVVRRHGGEILLRSPVTRILVENGRAIGVEVNGRQYYSRYVVSNADARVTYQDLIGSEHLPARFMDKLLHKWTPSCSCFSVWLGLDCEIETLGWSGLDVHYYRTFDRLMEMRADLDRTGGLLPSDLYSWVGASASHDPTLTPRGRAQVSLGVPIASRMENEWGRSTDGKRSQAYRDAKREIAERFINVACDLIPGLRSHIDIMEIATPLTYERYSRNRGGAYLGFRITPDFVLDPDRITSKGRIPGLYLSSNWSAVGGSVTNIMRCCMQGVDQMLAEDGRDDFYDFDTRYTIPRFEELLGTVVTA